MKKKTLGLIAGICSLGMMLSLSACGSNGGSSAKGSGDNIHPGRFRRSRVRAAERADPRRHQ